MYLTQLWVPSFFLVSKPNSNGKQVFGGAEHGAHRGMAAQVATDLVGWDTQLADIRAEEAARSEHAVRAMAIMAPRQGGAPPICSRPTGNLHECL